MTEKLLTTPETSAWFKERNISLKPATLEALRTRGGPMAPPFRRFGRAVRYAENDLLAWVESHLTGPAHSTTEARRIEGGRSNG